MFRKVSLLLLALILLASSACAQDVFGPGQRTHMLFSEAWDAGKEIVSRFSVTLNDVESLTEEEFESSEDYQDYLEATQAIRDAVNNAGLTLGCSKLEDGVRIRLLADYDATSEDPISAEMTLCITAEGLQAESSLLNEKAVSIRWETLLALLGVDEDTTGLLFSLAEGDTEELFAAFEEQLDEIFTIIDEVAPPYLELLNDFASSLAFETTEQVPADDFCPAAACAVTITASAKDFADLLTQFVDLLAADPVLAPMIDQTIQETDWEEEAPFTNVSELATLIYEELDAQSISTDPICQLTFGLDENDEPIYIIFNLQLDEESMFVAALAVHSHTEDAGFQINFDVATTDAEGYVEDGLSTTWDFVPSDIPSTYATTVDFTVFASGETLLTLSETVVSEAVLKDDLNGLAIDVQVDTSSIDQTSSTVTGSMTALESPDGGETMTYQLAGSSYWADELLFSFGCTLTQDTVVTPNGPTCLIQADVLHPFGDTITETLFVSTADPAPSAPNQLAWETLSEEDVDALFDELFENGMSLFEQLMSRLPQVVVESFAGTEADVIE